MKVFGREVLDKYSKKQKNSILTKHLNTWLKKTVDANWENSNDIRQTVTQVSILPHSRVVFNIVGGSYRLSVIVIYALQNVRIEWIGTHAEYDRLDLTKKIIKER